jgi:hypothetical protein
LTTKVCVLFSVLMISLSLATLVYAQTGNVYFKEEFDYASLDQMQAAGWTFTRPAGISVAASTVTLDGTGGDCAIHRATSFSNDVYDWKAEVRGMWLGEGHSVLSVFLGTERHSYGWAADGYYKEFSFYRDSQKVLHFGNYAEKANEYVVLTMVREGNIFSFYFNGDLINTYTEEDTLSSKVISLDLVSPWRGDAKYDYYQIGEPNAAFASLAPTGSTNSFPMVPVLIGGGITAAVIGGIAVYYFFIAGGSSASAGTSAGDGVGSTGAGSAGGTGSSGGGSVIQDHPISPLSGEAPLSPLAGQGGFVLEQMDNITQTMSILQDIVQNLTQENSSAIGAGASSGSSLADSNIAPTQIGLPFGGHVPVPTLNDIIDSLASQGQQLTNEGTTQGSIDQDNYQQYLENTTNLLDMITQIQNAQSESNVHTIFDIR